MDERTGDDLDFEYDVVIVGGGPAGCSAGVFTARYGLETLIFDRGRSSIQRCAHLENYLGFPAGIDVETFYALMHDHVETAGADLDADMVESVDRRGDGPGFVVETQGARTVSTRRVVTATRYDGEYMRGLDDDAAMFETHEHGGEEHEHFEREYADHDGRTPVDGLYVASPGTEADRQAIMAAGRGARVGLAVLEDVRTEQGFPADLADHYDWIRREAELSEEWEDRGRWREHFDDRTPDDHGLDEERRVALREAEIDRRFDSYLTDEEIDDRREAGQERLVDHVAIERVVEQVGAERLLEQVDDETILDAARDLEGADEAGEASD